MLRKLAALVLAPAVLLGAAGVTRAAAGSDSYAGSFVAKANAERTSRGLRGYVVKSDLAAVAARHSARMAKQGSLYHNPSLGSEVRGWQVVGENVGSGGSVESIHTAFMNSPSHRANILAKDYTEVGVGTVQDARGVIWVTQVFRLPIKAPTVAAPVTQQAARTVVRVPVRRPAVVKPPVVKPVPVAPRPPVVVVAPERPDATEFLAALAPRDAAPADPLSVALDYADTMAALVGS